MKFFIVLSCVLLAVLYRVEAVRDRTARVDPTANVHPSVNIGARSIIGAGVVIEADVNVGADVEIDEDTTLMAGASVLDGANIGRGCTIRTRVVIGQHTQINRNVTLVDNVRIGDRVQIGSDVDILAGTFGNDVCVDKNTSIQAVTIPDGSLVGEDGRTLPPPTGGNRRWLLGPDETCVISENLPPAANPPSTTGK